MSKVLYIKTHQKRQGIFQFAALLVYLVLATIFPTPAKTASQTGVASDDFNLVTWWLGNAVKQADTITDPNRRDEIYSYLGRVQALTGDVDGVNLSASAISNLNKRISLNVSAAKTFYKQANVSGYNKSMEQARLAASAQKNIASQIFINGNMVDTYLDCNDVNNAKSYAETLKDNSGKQSAYQKIAAYLASNGNTKDADAIVNSIIKASGKEFALVEIAETCIREGNLALAEQTVEKITGAKSKDRVYEKLGIALAEGGDIKKAADIEGLISSSIQKSAVIAAIAKHQIVSGDIDSGQKTAQEVSYRDHKVAVYTLIAEKQAEAGKIDLAVATIESMKKMIDDTPMAADNSAFGTFDDSFKKGMIGMSYLCVAKSMARSGDIEGYNKYIAKAIADIKEIKLKPPLWQDVALTKIIETQLEQGDIEGAKKTVNQIEEDYNHSWGLFNIVKNQLEKNDIAAAIATYKDIKETTNKSIACRDIASAFVKKGEINEAKQILLTLGNSSMYEAETYRETARVFVETGHTEELANWLEEMPTPQARVYACIGAAQGIMKNQNKSR